MDLIDVKAEGDCQEQCGTIFLTYSGNLYNLSIHCTLCEKNYKGFEEYASHIEKEHIAPDFFVTEEDEFVSYDDAAIASPVQNYDNCVGSVEKYENEEFILDESEEIFEAEYEKSSSQDCLKDERDSNCESIIVERLEKDDDIAESNTPEIYGFVKIEPTLDAVLNPKKIMRPLQSKFNSATSVRSHKCPHCEFSCNDRSNLLGHIKRHTSNKPHKCVECGKCFYTRTELKAHIRSHTGERPYLCTECGKTFGTSSKLSLHRKRHANLRDKECPMCDMKFYSATRLRDHMKVHSDDRPLKCDLCEASFKSYSSLKNHRKLHENQRNYKCPLCTATFNQNPGLYSHLKKKHSVVKSMDISEKDFKMDSEEI